MPRKKEEVEQETRSRPVAKGADAIATITISTSEGDVTRHLRIVGFTANTLPWQRKGKALDDILIKAFQNGFGGQVTIE